ncbi:MAG: tRNA (adenine(22)-N(1))-methyltransferase TrmK, partial [Planctomycetota bacterium]
MSWTLEEDDRARLARWPAPRVGGLGGRLSALALLVPEGAETVVDVGADHGQLGSGLLRAGRAQRVLAVDRSESALAGARAALAPWIQRGRARTALGDGLEPLVGAEPPWGKAACAVLAGLGGAAIAGILDRAAASGALPETVVTQP